MRLLLDTHALLWALVEPGRLPIQIRAAVEDSANAVFVSSASAWEMAIKQAAGKIDFPFAALAAELRRASLIELPVMIGHAQAAAALPPLHRDPFDRLLVAQAQSEGLSLVSRDPMVRQYQVTVLWAPELQAPHAAYKVKRRARRR